MSNYDRNQNQDDDNKLLDDYIDVGKQIYKDNKNKNKEADKKQTVDNNYNENTHTNDNTNNLPASNNTASTKSITAPGSETLDKAGELAKNTQKTMTDTSAAGAKAPGNTQNATSTVSSTRNSASAANSAATTTGEGASEVGKGASAAGQASAETTEAASASTGVGIPLAIATAALDTLKKIKDNTLSTFSGSEIESGDKSLFKMMKIAIIIVVIPLFILVSVLSPYMVILSPLIALESNENISYDYQKKLNSDIEYKDTMNASEQGNYKHEEWLSNDEYYAQIVDEDDFSLETIDYENEYNYSLDYNIEKIKAAFKEAYRLKRRKFIKYIIAENKRRKAENIQIRARNEAKLNQGITEGLEGYWEYYDIILSIVQYDNIDWESIFSDVNYAEFLSVSRSCSDLKYLTALSSAFTELLNDADKVETLIKMQVSDGRVNSSLVLVPKLKRYDGKILYEFYDADAYAYDEEFTNSLNYDLDEEGEEYLRELVPDYDFGSSKRSEYDNGFEDQELDTSGVAEWEVDQYGEPQYKATDVDEETGIPTIYSTDDEGVINFDVPDDIWAYVESLLNDDSLSEIQKAIIKIALSKLGCAYSLTRREDPGVYDCSSLVSRVMREAGCPIASDNPTAAGIAKILTNAGKEVSWADAQPGDIVCYSTGENGRYKDITHTGIWLGNGIIIDARGAAYGVVIRKKTTTPVGVYRAY